MPNLSSLEDNELPAVRNPVCTSCECENDIDDCINIDGKPYCPDCRWFCEGCETNFTDEDKVILCPSTSSGQASKMLCDNCSCSCDDCDRCYSDQRDGGINCSGDWVCPNCSESYFYCEGCNTTFHNNDYGDNGCCQSCMGEEEDADEEDADEEEEDSLAEIVRSHSYKPSPKFLSMDDDGPRGPETQYFGWEVEAEFSVNGEWGVGRNVLTSDARNSLASVLKNRPELYAKSDGSLDHGAEIVSHPGTFAYWMAYDFGLFGLMRADGWRSYDTKTCGMHVHISRASLSKRDIFRLMRFIHKNQELSFQLSRREDRHGEAMTHYAKLDMGTEATFARDVRKGVRDHNMRYRAINLTNPNTVEIRIFRGTINPRGVRRNLALCHALCKFVRETTPKKLSAQNFCGWLIRRGVVYLSREMVSELLKWVRQTFVPVDTGH
jgi:hypothetical protein